MSIKFIHCVRKYVTRCSLCQAENEYFRRICLSIKRELGNSNNFSVCVKLSFSVNGTKLVNSNDLPTQTTQLKQLNSKNLNTPKTCQKARLCQTTKLFYNSVFFNPIAIPEGKEESIYL